MQMTMNMNETQHASTGICRIHRSHPDDKGSIMLQDIDSTPFYEISLDPYKRGKACVTSVQCGFCHLSPVYAVLVAKHASCSCSQMFVNNVPMLWVLPEKGFLSPHGFLLWGTKIMSFSFGINPCDPNTRTSGAARGHVFPRHLHDPVPNGPQPGSGAWPGDWRCLS